MEGKQENVYICLQITKVDNYLQTLIPFDKCVDNKIKWQASKSESISWTLSKHFIASQGGTQQIISLWEKSFLIGKAPLANEYLDVFALH